MRGGLRAGSAQEGALSGALEDGESLRARREAEQSSPGDGQAKAPEQTRVTEDATWDPWGAVGAQGLGAWWGWGGSRIVEGRASHRRNLGSAVEPLGLNLIQVISHLPASVFSL